MRAADFKTRHVVKLTFESKEQAEEAYKRLLHIIQKGESPLYSSLLASALAKTMGVIQDTEEQL